MKLFHVTVLAFVSGVTVSLLSLNQDKATLRTLLPLSTSRKSLQTPLLGQF